MGTASYWFKVDDFDAVVERAAEMGVEMVMPTHRNPPDGKGCPNHWEFVTLGVEERSLLVAAR